MKPSGAQQSFEKRGIFWLGEVQEPHLSGTLHFSPKDGIELRLIGQFPEPLQQFLPMVHGTVEDAHCTLFACTQRRVKSSTLTLTEYQADRAIIGAHVASLKEAMFYKATSRFDCLDDWANYRAISVPPADIHQARGPSRFEISQQPTVSATVNALGCTISMLGKPNGTFSHRFIDWEYHAYLDIACSEPSSVHDLCSIVVELKHLISLLTWQRVRLAHFSFALHSSVPADPKISPWCEIFGAAEPQSESYHASNWPLTEFADLASYFPDIVNAWFASDKLLRDARGLLTGLINSEGQFLQFEFLALVQIVEALHRIKYPGYYTGLEEYEPIRLALESAIPSTVSTDHRQSLKSRIKYGNEISLRTRLKHLCLKLPDSLRNLITHDPASFISVVVDGRNYLTHRDEKSACRELMSEELQRTCQRLKLLLTIHFLHELGIPFTVIEKISQDRDWYTRQITW